MGNRMAISMIIVLAVLALSTNTPPKSDRFGATTIPGLDLASHRGIFGLGLLLTLGQKELDATPKPKDGT